VAQGLDPDPVYAGSLKSGAAAYPALCQDGDDLLVVYSNAKERIYLTRLNGGALF
jgi:hypothetical protein